MIKPTRLSPQEQRLNEKVWALRIKYDTFSAFNDENDMEIFDCPIVEFQKRTTQFKTPADFAMAIVKMSEYIESGQEVPTELYAKIQQTRKDFQV